MLPSVQNRLFRSKIAANELYSVPKSVHLRSIPFPKASILDNYSVPQGVQSRQTITRLFRLFPNYSDHSQTIPTIPKLFTCNASSQSRACRFPEGHGPESVVGLALLPNGAPTTGPLVPFLVPAWWSLERKKEPHFAWVGVDKKQCCLSWQTQLPQEWNLFWTFEVFL